VFWNALAMGRALTRAGNAFVPLQTFVWFRSEERRHSRLSSSCSFVPDAAEFWGPASERQFVGGAVHNSFGKASLILWVVRS
jgi:hypothetical protein